MRELDYPFDGDYLLKKRISLKKELLKTNGLIEKRIAILGGSTTSEIKNMLELFLLNFGIKPLFYESEYNRFYEDGMFDNPKLKEFAPDIIYIHTSFRNIINLPEANDKSEEVNQMLENEFERFENLWVHLTEEYGCGIIQNNFELPFYRLYGNQDGVFSQGYVGYVRRLNEKIADFARKHENFYIHDIEYESSLYGLEKWSDPLYWYMYKYAMCVPAIPFTAYGVATIIKAIFGKNKKVVCLDLDNTLWGGVIGDDGVENIEIGQETSTGQAYTEFQEYLMKLRRSGILLTVNSKNDEKVALSGFERPDMILKENDFAAFKANWNPKDRNLDEMAKELNLLPESFVFADDNPAEREIIRQSIEKVSIPKLTEPEHYIAAIDRAGYFETVSLSEDDLKRNEMYAANASRTREQAKFTDYGEYLDSLQMKSTIKGFESIYYARISQLTNKSNQFNLTTKRCSQSEIERMAADDCYITLYGKLEDRFGDNGVVSVVAGEVDNGAVNILLWLMSCRVLKRDMEYAMLDELVKCCREKGVDTIRGFYYPTAKNSMVKDFYSTMGFDKISTDEAGNTEWVLKVDKDYINKNKHICVSSEEK